MRTWGRYAAGLAVAGSVLFAAPAAAQISDSRGGWDHVNEPPPGAFSSADWCLALNDPDLVGEEIAIEAEGPSGPVSGTGIVGADGTVKVRVGITEGGPYAITSISVTSSGTSIDASDVDDIDVVFDPAFLDCFDGLMPAPVETTSTTTTTTTTTTVVPSTAAPTSSAAPTPPPEPEPADEGSGGGGGLLIGLGVGSLLLGTTIFASKELAYFSTERCERERREVERITSRIEKLRAKAKIDREAGESYLGRARRRRNSGKESDKALAEIDEADGRKAIDAAEAAEAEAAGMGDQLLAAQRALDACLKRGGGTGTRGGGTGGGPPTGPTAPPDETDDGSKATATDCCDTGRWIGINVSSAAEVGVGKEVGTLYLVCQTNPQRTAIVTWNGTRAGVAIGAEASTALFVLAGGPRHPAELEDAVKKVLGGWDFDISIGLSPIRALKTGWHGLRAGKGLVDMARTWGELGKAATKARTIEKTVKTLEKAGRDGLADKMTRESADALTDLAQSDLADGLLEQAAKSAASAGQSDLGGVNVPIVGLGLQIGFWKLLDVETDLLTYTGCDECDHP